MLYHFGFRRPLRVRGLDYAFTRSGCAPSSLYTFRFLGLARRWDFKPFTEFEALSSKHSCLVNPWTHVLKSDLLTN